MIGLDDEGTIWILNWPKYQNPAGLAQIRERSLMQIENRCSEKGAERIRELAAERQRRRRQKQKQGVVTCHALSRVTQRDECVTVTPPTGDFHRENVTPQMEMENKSVEEPSIISQGEIGTNGHRELSHDDLKKWLNTHFGRQRAWSYEEENLLAGLAPIAKGDRALLSWAYKLSRDSDGWVLIDGKRASKPKQSLIQLLREFSSEIDKWRSARRNGRAREPEAPEIETWSHERMLVFRQMFPGASAPSRFDLLGEDLQRRINERVRLREDEIPAEWVLVAKQLYPDASIPQFKRDLAPSVREEIKAALTISKMQLKEGKRYV
jgi:hypothetical protein